MPIFVTLNDLYFFHADGHIRHTENGCDQQHGDDDAQQCHPILPFLHLSGDGDQAEIVFYSQHLLKSVSTPSDTCKIRSAA